MAQLPDIPNIAAVDLAIQQDAREMARQAAVLDILPVALSDGEISDIEAFLHALTGETALDRPLGRPDQVPSGLPVD